MTKNAERFIKENSNKNIIELREIVNTLPHLREHGRHLYTNEDLNDIYQYLLEKIEDRRNNRVRYEIRYPPSQMYKVDESYSKYPTGKCENPSLGLPICEKGENKLCYNKLPCLSKIGQSKKDRINSKSEAESMVEDCRNRHKEDLEIFEKQMDVYNYDEMMKQILGY